MKDKIMPMAWNEPGKNNDNNSDSSKNPWTKKRETESPPDLDKIFKNLFGKLFGGNGGGSSGGGDKDGAASSGPGSLLILGLALVAYGLMGFYIVKPQEEAVVTRFGKYVRVESPGWHWLPPIIESKDVRDIKVVDTIAHTSVMLTKDENIVQVEVEVQYMIGSLQEYLFNVQDPVKSLNEATESALRQVIGSSTLDHVITTGRSEVTADVKEQIIQTLNMYRAGIEVRKVNMQDAKPPEEVKSAFDDVTKAREDLVKLTNEAESYANKIKPEALGQAKRIKQEALAYKEQVIQKAKGDASRFDLIVSEYKKSPEITKQRLYLDTVEEVLSKTSKVLLDMNETSNSLIYLPIDKILEKRDTTSKDERLSRSLDTSEYQAAKEQIASNLQKIQNEENIQRSRRRRR